MEGLELECEHGLSREMNCYTCFLDFYYKDKREDKLSWLDTIHEAISELKTRISKLEEYKRLQDESNAELNSRQNDVEATLQLIPMNLENTMEVNINILHEKLKEMEEQQQKHDDKINILLMKLITLDAAFKDAITDFESPTEDDFVKFDPADYIDEPKTTGLTFEEAIVALKAGKKIRRKTFGDFYTSIEKAQHGIVLYDLKVLDVITNDWEIVK